MAGKSVCIDKERRNYVTVTQCITLTSLALGYNVWKANAPVCVYYFRGPLIIGRKRRSPRVDCDVKNWKNDISIAELGQQIFQLNHGGYATIKIYE